MLSSRYALAALGALMFTAAVSPTHAGLIDPSTGEVWHPTADEYGVEMGESDPFESEVLWEEDICDTLLSDWMCAPDVSVSVGLMGSENRADLLAVLAMGILVDCRTGGGSRFGAWPLLPLGLVAALTFSSHLALWPTLLLGALALRLPRRRIAILGAAAMLAVAIYAGLGGQFATATVREPADPVVLLVYLGRFLGGLFGRDATISCVVGWAGVVVAAALGWTLWRRGPEAAARTPLVFWTMVQLYAAANGLLAGLGRADRGELQPTVSRYALYPALFWLATAVLFTLLRSDAWTARRRRRALAILGLFLLASASSMTARAESEIAVFLNRGHRQVVTERALQWDAWDLELLGATMSQRPEKVVELLDVLRGLGHVPFDRPAPPWPERKVVRTERSGASSAELEGLFGSVQSTRDPAIVRVRGWVRSPGPVVEEVVFVDVRGDRRSWIAAGLPPPRLEADPDDGHEGGSGWEGFVRRDGPQIVWRPLVRLRGEEFFHPLRRASHLDRRLREMGPPGTSDAVYTAPPKPSDP